MSDRIPLVYIAGTTHSGSTLLDLMLGSLPGVWTLGEIQVLPALLRGNARPCGCGRPLSECDFWAPLLRGRNPDEGRYPQGFFRDGAAGSGRARARLLAEAVAGVTSGWSRAAAEEYGRANHSFLAAVRARAAERAGGEVRWLVDASKSPYRLIWLALSGLFEIRVVHLTRDPRGFVHSLMKLRGGSLARAARLTVRWLVWNFLAAKAGRLAAGRDHMAFVRYEDLAGDPDGTMRRLGDWLGSPPPGRAADGFRRRQNHAVGGNAMRWDSSGISPDEEWRVRLSPLHRLAAGALSWPWRRRCGY